MVLPVSSKAYLHLPQLCVSLYLFSSPLFIMTIVVGYKSYGPRVTRTPVGSVTRKTLIQGKGSQQRRNFERQSRENELTIQIIFMFHEFVNQNVIRKIIVSLRKKKGRSRMVLNITT